MLGLAGECLDEFLEAWNRYDQDFYEVANVLSKIDEKIPPGPSKSEYLKRLPFSRSNYSKWCAIGRSISWLSEDMRRILTPRLSVVYAFIQLGESDALRFMKDRHIKWPPVKREEIARWKKTNKVEQTEAKDTSVSTAKSKASKESVPVVPGRFYSALKPKHRLTFSEMEALNKRLDEIAKEYDLEVVFPPVPPGRDTTEKVNAHMRKEINRLIRDTLTSRAEKFPARKKSLMTLAGELRIYADDDEQRMRDSLDEIDLAHEFDRIRSEAYDAHPMEGPGYPEWWDAVENNSPSTALREEEVEELRKTISQTSNNRAGIFGLTPDERRARLSGIT